MNKWSKVHLIFLSHHPSFGLIVIRLSIFTKMVPNTNRLTLLMRAKMEFAMLTQFMVDKMIMMLLLLIVKKNAIQRCLTVKDSFSKNIKMDMKYVDCTLKE